MEASVTTAHRRPLDVSSGRRLRRLPDRVLQWGLTALAARDPGPDRVLLHPADRPVASRRSARRAQLRLRQRLGSSRATSTTARPLRGRHADHVGDRAHHRRAGGGRDRAVSSPSCARAGSRTPLAILVDLLAAVPSVVYGLWGVFVLAPKLLPAEQWFANTFSFIPFIGGGIGNAPRTTSSRA